MHHLRLISLALCVAFSTGCGVAEYIEDNNVIGECPRDFQNCNGGCIPLDDINHCGKCDNVCGGNAKCVLKNGTHACQCDAGWGACGNDGCTYDLNTSEKHCGECNNLCRGSEQCINGQCECQTLGKGLDYTNDPNNCKVCGNRCQDNGNKFCENGDCTCGDGTSSCDDVPELCSVQYLVDPRHCGRCKIVCPPTQGGLTSRECTQANETIRGDDCASKCVDGICQCDPGFKLCQKSEPENEEEAEAKATDACLDIKIDERCGDCETRCHGGQHCTPDDDENSYACRCPSETPDLCDAKLGEADLLNGQTCVNIKTNIDYCNECKGCEKRVHATVDACVEGVCQYRCDEGYADCDGDLQIKQGASNTGCEKTLDEAHVTDAACQTCQSPWVDCNGKRIDGCEINNMTDADNCGNCGTVCEERNRSHRSCSGGSCHYDCEHARADCNDDLNVAQGQATDGCEKSFYEAHVTNAACTECTSSYRNCNGIKADGCEINTYNNDLHCGGCWNDCTITHGHGYCVAYTCYRSCYDPYENCNGSWSDGCEINTSNDDDNCGECDNSCWFGRKCRDSDCGWW